MPSKCSGRSELTESMSDHFFIDVDTYELSSVVYSECVSDEIRNDLSSSIPNFDNFLVSVSFSLLDLFEDLRMNSESFLE